MEDFVRDHAMYAVIFGFFGFSWFGWAQAEPPATWRLPLGIASGACLAIALTGLFFAIREWSGATALSAPGAHRTFGIIFGIEFMSALLGSLVLMKIHKTAYIAPWIAAVVGIHFSPLAAVFKDAGLYLLSVLVTLAPITSIFIARMTSITAGTVTCITTGSLLFVFAIRGLVLVVR